MCSEMFRTGRYEQNKINMNKYRLIDRPMGYKDFFKKHVTYLIFRTLFTSHKYEIDCDQH